MVSTIMTVWNVAQAAVVVVASVWALVGWIRGTGKLSQAEEERIMFRSNG